MDGVDVSTTSKGTRHLLDAVAFAIKQDDFGVRIHPAQELLIVRDGGINEDDFLSRLDRQIGSEGLEQLLAVSGPLSLAAAVA